MGFGTTEITINATLISKYAHMQWLVGLIPFILIIIHHSYVHPHSYTSYSHRDRHTNFICPINYYTCIAISFLITAKFHIYIYLLYRSSVYIHRPKHQLYDYNSHDTMNERPVTASIGLDRLEAERIIAILDDTVEKLGFLDRYNRICSIYYRTAPITRAAKFLLSPR